MPVNLERLYFKAVDMSRPNSRWLAAHAPTKLTNDKAPNKSKSISTRLHQLPAYSNDMQWAIIVGIRQTHGRATALWWAFYRNEQRQAVWHFAPPDDKNMGVYRISSIESLHCIGEVAIKVTADQYFNGGRCRCRVNVCFLANSNPPNINRLNINRACALKALKIATDSTFTVSTEKRQKQLLEDKEIQPSESLLALCGYQDPREK